VSGRRTYGIAIGYVFLQKGGSLEAAQVIANTRTRASLKLYDRRKDLATLGEIERRIAFE